MRGKLLFVTGIAVGYVLGARAGRQRYEQIKSAAESVWNTPAVQSGVDTAKDFALARVGDVSDSVLDGVKKLISAATNSNSNSKPKSSSARSYSTPARPANGGSASTAASVHHTESYTVAEPVDQPAPKKPAARKPAPSGQATRKKPSSSESE
ncbi:MULTISPECIES: YtxH domain-containing protein [unclassified Leifsonia]|uniref:YtxH domain-containing protein n=1 Tax=unclassified Leifsonia TaxID=2663824 RepID=UPI000AE26909|nr:MULTISPECIES: YtxH domain-containing protein [unclassified Leifsonia]